MGQRRKGAIILGLFALLAIGFWPLRLLSFYFGSAGLYLFWILLYAYSACSAAMAGTRPDSVRASKRLLLLVVPITLLTTSLIGAGVTRLSGFRSFIVPSSSMEKTIREGDRIVADMNFYRSRNPGKQEIILFKRDGIFFVKRVIGTGGDTVEGSRGMVFVNGQPLIEDYVQHTGEVQEGMNDFGPDLIPAGKYFVMGDNRDISLDSRSPEFGLVPASSVVGKPLYVFASNRDGKPVN